MIANVLYLYHPWHPPQAGLLQPLPSTYPWTSACKHYHQQEVEDHAPLTSIRGIVRRVSRGFRKPLSEKKLKIFMLICQLAIIGEQLQLPYNGCHCICEILLKEEIKIFIFV